MRRRRNPPSYDEELRRLEREAEAAVLVGGEKTVTGTLLLERLLNAAARAGDLASLWGILDYKRLPGWGWVMRGLTVPGYPVVPTLGKFSDWDDMLRARRETEEHVLREIGWTDEAASVRDTPRTHFNWGYHQAIDDATDERPRPLVEQQGTWATPVVAREFDPWYYEGYRHGLRNFYRGLTEDRNSSSDPAWLDYLDEVSAQRRSVR